MSGLTVKNGSSPVVSTTVTYVNPSSSATSTQVKTWNNGKVAYTYTYDNKGNITSITGGGLEFEYRYDKYGRLISAEDYPGGYVWTYTYDDGGNITQRGLTDYYNNKNPNSILATYTYDNTDWPDLLTAFNGKSITYDAIGNPLSDGTWTYAWQHGRQLASMSKSGSSITYGYNANGKRISKTVNGTTYNYSYLGDQLTEMTWGSNKLHFTYDSTGPASVTYNGNRYFYLKNAQGDVTGLVNASGTQVVSYTYDPWGAPMSTDGTMASTLGAANPLRYRGYVYDTETGLYYLTSRYYNPVWGRFINADTADVLGASPDKANWDKNLFAYCDNDPVSRKDDGGDLWDFVIGAAVGVATTFISSKLEGKDASVTDYLVAGLCGGLGGLNVGRTASAIIGAVTGFVGSIYDNTTSGKKVSFGELILDATLAAGFGALNSVLDPGFNSTKMDKLSGRILGTAKKAMDKISAGKPVTKVVKNALRSDVKRVAASAISGFGVGFAYSMTFWGSRKAGNAIYRAYR